MTRHRWRSALGRLAFASTLLLACEVDETELAEAVLREGPDPTVATFERRVELNPRLLRRFESLQEVPDAGEPASEAQVKLGYLLFFEPRFSAQGSMSCSSCHALDRYGVDGETTSAGWDGTRGVRNAPTVYNAAGQFRQFWDGRAASVEEQALGPILNPSEMNAPDSAYVERVLRSIPGYVDAFADAFPEAVEPVTFENVGAAIGAFERRLVTRSRWDEYLEGNTRALMASERQGLRVFANLGCMVCHTGEYVGGSMFAKVGAVQPWPNQADEGRFEHTNDPADSMVFKVPSLRNVTKTGPYFHDGSAATLEEAIILMGRHQLGVELESDEVAAIVAWLGSLTGTLPPEYVAGPALPPSGATTPVRLASELAPSVRKGSAR